MPEPSNTPLVGALFPVGGPVAPDAMIGRQGDVADLVHQTRQRVHTLVVGPRRIGKTTVCDAACERLRDEFVVLGRIEVPERRDSRDLLQAVAQAVAAAETARSPERLARAITAAAAPTLQQIIRERIGIDVDLSALERDPTPASTRAILALPLNLAVKRSHGVLLYLDEVQRIAGYEHGRETLRDLVDLYSGQGDVVVLMDGSEERALEELLAPPVDLAKLAQRHTIPLTIDEEHWQPALRKRFERLQHPLDPAAERRVLRFGAGRPIDTMAAAQGTALTITKLPPGERVDVPIAREGLRIARERLQSLDR